jgi:hypothetical protein
MRMKERSESVEPMDAASSSDRFDPALQMPYTDIELPNRLKVRKERCEPRFITSNSEADAPWRQMQPPITDIALPMRTQLRMDTLDPMPYNASKIEQDEPSRHRP